MELSAGVNRDERVGRAFLVFAALSGFVMLVLGGLGFGHSHLGSVDGRQTEALLIALFSGFGLAAWRPARLAVGVMPVAVFAAVITFGLSLVELRLGNIGLIDELSHVPLFAGAVGTIFATRGASPAVQLSGDYPTGRDGSFAVASARSVQPT
jgi:hypothetical protein